VDSRPAHQRRRKRRRRPVVGAQSRRGRESQALPGTTEDQGIGGVRDGGSPRGPTKAGNFLALTWTRAKSRRIRPREDPQECPADRLAAAERENAVGLADSSGHSPLLDLPIAGGDPVLAGTVSATGVGERERLITPERGKPPARTRLRNLPAPRIPPLPQNLNRASSTPLRGTL